MVKYNTSSDNELAALLNQGDKVAYTEIYRRYHAALYIHVFNKLRSRDESRDIIHDLFSSLWQKPGSVNLKKLPLQPTCILRYVTAFSTCLPVARYNQNI